MSDHGEQLEAPLLGARTANAPLFTGARARDLEEGAGDDDAATTTTTMAATAGARQYVHRRNMFMSGRDRDLEDARQAEARDQLSDWAQMLRSLSRTRRGAEVAAAEASAEASRHALQTATRAGFHRARVDLYEGSNLDTPESEQTRRAAEARSSMGRATTIVVRWVLVVLIVLAAVLVAFGIHECSRWGQHATRLATELAYKKSGVCWLHTHTHPPPALTLLHGNHQKKSWAAVAAFTGVGTLFAAAAGFIMWRVNPTLKGGVNEVLCYLNGIVVNHVCVMLSSVQTHTRTCVEITASTWNTELWTKAVSDTGPRPCTGDSQPNGSRPRGTDARDRRADRGWCGQFGNKKRCQRV